MNLSAHTVFTKDRPPMYIQYSLLLRDDHLAVLGLYLALSFKELNNSSNSKAKDKPITSLSKQ